MPILLLLRLAFCSEGVQHRLLSNNIAAVFASTWFCLRKLLSLVHGGGDRLVQPRRRTTHVAMRHVERVVI
eukprot:5476887-Alexandrium_andersonii.AAC.1